MTTPPPTRILITGASGFVGSHLLTAASHHTVLAQHFTNPIRPQREGLQQIKMDFRRPNWQALRRFRPRIIFHLGGMTSIHACEADPKLAEEINVGFSAGLARVAGELKARMIFTSTDLVFGGSRGNYRETDAPAPRNAYARSKLAAEQQVLSNQPQAAVVRLALVYGKSLNDRPTFTGQLVKRLSAGESAELFADEFRTPVFVDDLVAALWTLARSDFAGCIHLGGPDRLSRHGMGLAIASSIGADPAQVTPSSVEQFDPDHKRPRDCSLESALAVRVLKWRRTSYAEGVRRAFGSRSSV